MTTHIPLSTDDLPFFFDDKHHALASHLRSAAPGLIEASLDHSGRKVAAEMGARHQLYDYVCPDDGQLDIRSLVLIREMLGYVSPLADAIFAVQGLGSFPIAFAGTDEQKKRLPSFRDGSRITGFALTEPEAGSDVASMQTHAKSSEDGFVLNGDKIFISNADIASDFVVFANADPAAGRKGISAFCVPADAKGLHIEHTELSIDHPVGHLKMRDCHLPSSALLGEVGGGFGLAMATLDRFRVTVGAAAVGMARRAFDESRAHVCKRKQFGKALAKNQLVMGYLAEMSTNIDASRLLVLRAAKASDDGAPRVSTEAAKAKLFATEAAQVIIDKAVQLFGGLGVVRGNPAEMLYRAIRPLRIYEGTSEIQKLIIGRAVIKEVSP